MYGCSLCECIFENIEVRFCKVFKTGLLFYIHCKNLAALFALCLLKSFRMSVSLEILFWSEILAEFHFVADFLVLLVNCVGDTLKFCLVLW